MRHQREAELAWDAVGRQIGPGGAAVCRAVLAAMVLLVQGLVHRRPSRTCGRTGRSRAPALGRSRRARPCSAAPAAPASRVSKTPTAEMPTHIRSGSDGWGRSYEGSARRRRVAKWGASSDREAPRRAPRSGRHPRYGTDRRARRRRRRCRRARSPGSRCRDRGRPVAVSISSAVRQPSTSASMCGHHPHSARRPARTTGAAGGDRAARRLDDHAGSASLAQRSAVDQSRATRRCRG